MTVPQRNAQEPEIERLWEMWTICVELRCLLKHNLMTDGDRMKWRHAILWQRYDLHVVEHDVVLCEVNWRRFVTLLLAREYCFARWRLSSSVTLHCGPAGGFTRAGQAMTSCRLQSNYSFTVTLHGGPVVLRPIKATPCLNKTKSMDFKKA